jgi:uncharacterized protein YcbX
MYQLVDIIIYPIKSLGKVSLQKSLAQIRGFQYDRRMMLTDEGGNFLSQRRYPEMARFKVSLVDEKGFLVKHEGEELFIPLNMHGKKSRKVIIWDDQLLAPEADPYFSKWFSQHLNIKCFLITMDEQTRRHVDKRYAINDETVSFSDGFPYLMIGSASLDDLNDKTDVPIPMDRFRPNMVIKTEIPFVEDHFEVFHIGDATFKRSKPCARCIITTTDQNTGVREKEPLKTLSEYRQIDNKILFGQNIICLKEGMINIGEEMIAKSNDQNF